MSGFAAIAPAFRRVLCPVLAKQLSTPSLRRARWRAPLFGTGDTRPKPRFHNPCWALTGRESLRGLPFANVRAAVHVQHLAGHLTGLRQIKDGIHNVFHRGNPPRRLPVNERIQRDTSV